MARTGIPKADVLVIEPEALSCQYVIKALQHLDIHPHVKTEFPESQEQEPDSLVNLIILGLDLDKANNLLLIAQAHKHYPDAVTMGICPRIAPAERVALLNSGLDFIIEKPFFVEECVSAVQAILRRLVTHESPQTLRPQSQNNNFDEKQ